MYEFIIFEEVPPCGFDVSVFGFREAYDIGVRRVCEYFL